MRDVGSNAVCQDTTTGGSGTTSGTAPTSTGRPDAAVAVKAITLPTSALALFISVVLVAPWGMLLQA